MVSEIVGALGMIKKGTDKHNKKVPDKLNSLITRWFQFKSSEPNNSFNNSLKGHERKKWFGISYNPKKVLFTNPSARAGYDTRSIFKRSLTGLNSEEGKSGEFPECSISLIPSISRSLFLIIQVILCLASSSCKRPLLSVKKCRLVLPRNCLDYKFTSMLRLSGTNSFWITYLT